MEPAPAPFPAAVAAAAAGPLSTHDDDDDDDDEEDEEDEEEDEEEDADDDDEVPMDTNPDPFLAGSYLNRVPCGSLPFALLQPARATSSRRRLRKFCVRRVLRGRNRWKL